MNFIAIDFETTAYGTAQTNEPWQLGLAVVRNSCIVETHEFFFDVEGAPPKSARIGRFRNIIKLLRNLGAFY